MAVSTTPISDARIRSPHAEADLSTSKEKPRPKRRRKNNRQRLAEAARSNRSEHEQRQEVPFTVWDRTNPDVLMDPNRSPAQPPAQPPAETSTPEKPKQPTKTAKEVPAKPSAKPAAKSKPIQAPKPKKSEAPITARQNHKVPAPPTEPAPPEPALAKHKITNASTQEQRTKAMPEATHESLTAIEQARREAERSFLWSEAETPNPARDIAEDREESAQQAAAEQPTAPKPLRKEQASKLVHEAAEEQPSALHIGEQLRRVAEQTAARAAELSARNQPEKDSKQEESTSTKPEKPAKPAAETSATETQPKREKPAATTPEARAETAEHAGSIAREELMALAASIRVEGVSIEEMFKAKRIDEEGLRRIVVAFLRGEDIRRLVADEVIRQQMRFERDPQLRDTSLTVSPDTHKSSAKPPRTRHVAVRAKTHAKAALDPARLRHNANRLSNRILDGVDRTRDLATEHPSGAKTAAVATAILVYFIILIAIIRA